MISIHKGIEALYWAEFLGICAVTAVKRFGDDLT
jgi:hypothetical protein